MARVFARVRRESYWKRLLRRLKCSVNVWGVQRCCIVSNTRRFNGLFADESFRWYPVRPVLGQFPNVSSVTTREGHKSDPLLLRILGIVLPSNLRHWMNKHISQFQPILSEFRVISLLCQNQCTLEQFWERYRFFSGSFFFALTGLHTNLGQTS